MTTEQQLPKGWTKTTLEEICEIFDSKRVPLNREQREQRINNKKTDELFPYYGATGEVGKIDDYIFDGEFVLLGEDAAPFFEPNKNVAYCVKGKFWVNNHAHILSSSVLENLYICHYLNQFNFSGYVSGTTRLKLSQGSMKRIPIIYPTSKETQQAIVNKIESLFDEIDEGIGRLKTAAQQIQQYRQSLLKNAFNGELTKEWRSKHADTLPSENELLAQIQTTREQHHAQQLANWQTAVSQWEQNGKEGKKPSKPSTLKKLESIEKLNEIELTELPNGWFWERLGLMTLGVEYGTSAKSQPEGKVPVLRMGNMQNGKIDWTDLVYSDNDEEIKQYSLKKGDVLFNRTNSPELVGKTSIIETDEKAIFAGYLIRINHLTEITDGRYLTYFLNSMIAKKYGNFVKTDGVNQSNINGQKLINYPFVFCSLEEQKEVANILEQKLTACDQLAAELAKQLKQADLLKQAVLKAAFSGSLLDK